MNIEHCFICDNPTGRAGIAEDSFYDKEGCGPYCEECWEEMVELTIETEKFFN